MTSTLTNLYADCFHKKEKSRKDRPTPCDSSNAPTSVQASQLYEDPVAQLVQPLPLLLSPMLFASTSFTHLTSTAYVVC